MSLEAHERVVAAARAGLVKARELELPVAEPADGVNHEYEKHIARIERVMAHEIEQNDKLRAAVAKLLRTVKVLVPAVVGLFVVSTIVYAIAYGRIASIAKENRRLALANARTQVIAARQARKVIREACDAQDDDRRRLRIIIRRNEVTTQTLVEEGTLSQAQADRALRDSRRARRDLSPADCSGRAARIPIPNVAVRDGR